MLLPTTLTITDDSGFLAIANADRYNSFVDFEWELPQLLNHFIDEMNNGNLIIWRTDSENRWTIDFRENPSSKKAFREFVKTIEVTHGRLFLTNYEDLTIAAQFHEEKIPAKHNADLYVKLDNGNYELTIRQLFDPKDFQFEEEGKVNFELVIRVNAKKRVQKIDRIIWWDN